MMKQRPKPAPVVLPADIDIAAVRIKLRAWPRVTQEEFAARFGLSASAVRDWEQNRRKPDAAARTLLALIAQDPLGIEAAIQRIARIGNRTAEPQ